MREEGKRVKGVVKQEKESERGKEKDLGCRKKVNNQIVMVDCANNNFGNKNNNALTSIMQLLQLVTQ